MNRDTEAGHRLLDQVVGLPITVVTTEVMELEESIAEHIVLQLDEEDVEVSAIGLLFAIGVLSFADAAPRGYSHVEYVEKDSFGLGDLLTHMRYANGALQLSTDYLRGRMMKTDVTIHADGKVAITTRNRGEAASRWVMRLRGRRVLRPIDASEKETERDE